MQRNQHSERRYVFRDRWYSVVQSLERSAMLKNIRIRQSITLCLVTEASTALTRCNAAAKYVG